MSAAPCTRLDAYLDGDLDALDARAFEAHAADCEPCALDLAAAERLETEWATLRSVTAPPALVQAALTQARRTAAGPTATDRAPARPSHRRFGRFASVGLPVLVLVAIGALIWTTQSGAPDEPLHASADPPPPETVDTATAARPLPAAPDDPPVAEAPALDPAPARAAPRTPVARQRSAPAPRRAVVTPDEPGQALAQTAPVPPDSVVQARQDLMLALSLLADAQTLASAAVAEEITRAATSLSDTPAF